MTASQAVILIVGSIPIVWVALSLLDFDKVDLTRLLIVKAPFNRAAFALRKLVRLPLRHVAEQNEPKQQLFSFLSSEEKRTAEEREATLRRRYDLATLHGASSQNTYRENLYCLDVLDRVRELVKARTASREEAPLLALDVGSMDFRYAVALERWLRTFTKQSILLTGIELDGHVIYRDLTTRRDHGHAHARKACSTLADVRYDVANFVERADRNQDVVFFWFPFVLRYALLRWGLPLGMFQPTKMFERARDALKPGGLLVVVNHTEEESRAQRELISQLGGFSLIANERADSDLVDYADHTSERRVLVFEKLADASVQRVMLLPPASVSALDLPRIAPLRATKTRLDGREQRFF